MKTFHLLREHDVSGVSGTGTVAKGVVFDDGAVALRWTGETRSTVIYDSIEDVLKIHGHIGLTQVVYDQTTEEALIDAAQRIVEFDPSDAYEFSNPGRHIPGFAVGYYAAIDRAENLLHGRIDTWTDNRPAPQNRAQAED